MERAMAKVQADDGPAAVCVAGASADGLGRARPSGLAQRDGFGAARVRSAGPSVGRCTVGAENG